MPKTTHTVTLPDGATVPLRLWNDINQLAFEVGQAFRNGTGQ